MIDWSNYELSIESHGIFAIVHTLTEKEIGVLRDSKNISFVNIKGHGLLITGDWGNWSFKRQFVPMAGGRASSRHWVMSLTESNHALDPYVFDSKKLARWVDRVIPRVRRSCISISDEAAVERFAAALKACESITDFGKAVRCDRPSFMIDQTLPDCIDIDPLLQVVSEAFDEICRRLGEKCCDTKKSG